MADDDDTDSDPHELEPPAQPDTNEVVFMKEDGDEPGPNDPWATIRKWAAAMVMTPPDGITPMRIAFDQVLAQTAGDIEISGPWLDRIAVWGFHMHIRPQRIAPEILRTGHIDEEAENSVWYRAPRYSVGAPQNRLWLGVATDSLDELLAQIRGEGTGDSPATASPAAAGTELPTWDRIAAPVPAATGPRYEADESLRCRLCDLQWHGHWLLLSLGGRLVQVCMGCAREVAAAVRRK